MSAPLPAVHLFGIFIALSIWGEFEQAFGLKRSADGYVGIYSCSFVVTMFILKRKGVKYTHPLRAICALFAINLIATGEFSFTACDLRIDNLFPWS